MGTGSQTYTNWNPGRYVFKTFFHYFFFLSNFAYILYIVWLAEGCQWSQLMNSGCPLKWNFSSDPVTLKGQDQVVPMIVTHQNYAYCQKSHLLMTKLCIFRPWPWPNFLRSCHKNALNHLSIVLVWRLFLIKILNGKNYTN